MYYTFSAFNFDKEQPNGLRYLRVGGRGFCFEAEKTRRQKKLGNGNESHTSTARFVVP